MMDETNAMPRWQVGQRVVVNRSRIATIDRVMAHGIAVVEREKYRPNGYRVGPYRGWGDIPQILPLTPELEAKVVLYQRVSRSRSKAFAAIETAEKWIRTIDPSRASQEDAGKIDCLISAIYSVVECVE